MARAFSQSEAEGPKGWAVWKVAGRIDLQTAPAAQTKGEEFVKRNGKTALDMSEVDYLSSVGIRVLILLRTLAEKLGHEFTVFGAKGTAKYILEGSGIDELLNLKESPDELE